jgi:hypothetical protein
MKRILVLFLAVFVGVSLAHADAPTVESAVAVDQNTKPTDTFPATTPQLYAFFKSTGTHKGDKFRVVWIAEDVGDAAPKETKIDESTILADGDDFYGAGSLTKPTAGWPVGKYRVEIYLGDDLVSTSKFTIEAAQ